MEGDNIRFVQDGYSFCTIGKYKILWFIPHVRCRKIPTSRPELIQRIKVGENGT